MSEYAAKEQSQGRMNRVPDGHDVLFREVDVVDPSAFRQVLRVHGVG